MQLLVENTTKILEELSGEYKKDVQKFYKMLQKTSEELVQRKPKCSIYTNLSVTHFELEKLPHGTQYKNIETLNLSTVKENFEVIEAGFNSRLVERSEQIFGVQCKDLSEVYDAYINSVINDIKQKCKQPANARTLKKYHDGKLVSIAIQEKVSNYKTILEELDTKPKEKEVIKYRYVDGQKKAYRYTDKQQVNKQINIPCCKLTEGKHIEFKITKHAKKAKKLITVFSYIKELGGLQQATEKLTKDFTKMSVNANLKMDQLEQVWEKYNDLRVKYDNKKKEMIAGLKEKKQYIKQQMKEDIASYRHQLKGKIEHLKQKAAAVKNDTNRAYKRIGKLNKYIAARNNPSLMRAVGYLGRDAQGLPIRSLQQYVDNEEENGAYQDYNDYEADSDVDYNDKYC
jgi:hypothetical protein